MTLMRQLRMLPRALVLCKQQQQQRTLTPHLCQLLRRLTLGLLLRLMLGLQLLMVAAVVWQRLLRRCRPLWTSWWPL
jgi:hypothetical protein